MQEEKENVPNLANDHLFWQNTKGTIHLGRLQFGGGGGQISLKFAYRK